MRLMAGILIKILWAGDIDCEGREEPEQGFFPILQAL